ncbi:PREDICTED: Down syndrome cell adhesion molecule-like protein Dscam2 isoform X2 [Nicrophorus vespilloides]|uniref:Down syndrome cell adhesion molecule-like protein Dscam2 isoform X2 n=1 Tax=Nicrophorus vespilloides TaxID=110193 RepID=A0ABM1MPG2_NICVS|nr:PREDICTED: Down syndrome cell adhesion molecule-like protein Dscam2 isoform X2 [Nicrophorus vespilloides]
MDPDNFILHIIIILLAGANGQSHGPVFLLEPPSQLTFSNTSGSQVSCSAHGSPTPQVDWLLQDGQTVMGVPGLRQSLGNGTLYFPPFRAEDYRKDVHFTVYRCRASNLAGSIISRDVNVRAVVSQHYEVQVYHTHVLAGNTAVLSCVIPAFVKEHVSVTSWSRDESILLPGSNMGGRIVVTYGSGELHIRSVRAEDGLAKYSCLTLHILTQERKRSAPAILTVTEPTGSMPPRLAPSVQTSLSADTETDVHLTCSAQGNPPPTFNWYREVNGHLQPVYSNPRYAPLQDILHIKRLNHEDAGRWTCKVTNHFGEQKLDMQLTVTAQLNVHVLPQLQIVNSGENAMFNCTVSGSPVGRVQWLRNGEPILADMNSRIRLLSHLVLSVSGVTRHDRGMYQCIVRNDRESCQGSAELRLGGGGVASAAPRGRRSARKIIPMLAMIADTVPELQYTFIEQALRPGPQISLRCSATGSPPPQFRWLLDGEPLTELTVGHRYAIGQYVDQSGDVITHLNITNVRVEDGGLYICRAVNSLGSAEHASRLNIYGPPYTRSIAPVKAVAGSDVTLHCPYSGYPIDSVRWKRHGQDLPLDLRHRLEDGGALIISRLDPVADSDIYTCFVSSRDGEMAHRNIQLIVHSPPILEPFTFPTSLQEGGRAQVTCYVTSGDMPIHFAWYKDDMPISASLQVEERAAEFYSMLIFKEVTSKHSGAYTCVASNSAARANYTANLMVKVAPQWIIEPQDLSVLLGNAVIVDCAAKGFPHPQITWLKGQGKTNADYKPLLSLHGRAVLLSNGSIWMEAVGPQDEGHYLCRATNGIGSGLGKVIYVSVNEPARFDIATRNVSTKRGGPVVLICHVYGDTPIEIMWTMNGNRMNLNNYRFTLTESKTENGLKSQVTINRSDRDDSGVYKCLAENAYGRSDHIINLAVQERPDAPGVLEVVEVASRNVRLAWRKPFDGNSPIIGYLVQYQPLSVGYNDWENSAVQNITLPIVQTLESSGEERESAVMGGLYPATAYKIRMMALNSIDQSPFTEEVVVKTQEEEPAEAPRDVQVEPVGASELFVSWQVPSRESWNGDLLGYIVNWNIQGVTNNASSKTLTVKGWGTTKVQLTGLKKFTKYDINVRAFNSVSVGPLSPTVVGTTREGVPEASPMNIQCSQMSSQSMKVSWISPLPAYHGGIIQGYKIYYRPIATEENADVPATGEVKRTPSTETYLHGLYKYTNYSLRVLAYTGAGDGILSLPIYCTTEEDVPGPPASIKAAALTAESILVSWLPPSKPNGRIHHYTVYGREAGRVGKHTTHSVRVEDSHHNPALLFEVRNLVEHQLYEFWVSATTNVGEGEPTSIVAQATNTRAPSRIASFSQVLHKAVKSKVSLPCLAVGNPTPRTRWIHRDRPITFSPFYEVTTDGHLSIYSVDQSLAGNYSCSAKNLFGEDEITYSMFVMMPPSAPNLEVQFTTAKSVRLHWSQPEDGGSMIQGYTLNSKRYTDDWISLEISPENLVYTYDGLQCGTIYHIYILAHNRVGNGSPSSILTVSTKGGPPQVPKEKDFIMTNATVLQLNLFNWPDGGCPISHFSVTYKAIGDQKWTLISSSVSGEKLVIQDLVPATWYQLRVSAQNDAGLSHGVFTFATTTLAGGRIPPPPSLSDDNDASNAFTYKDTYILIPAISIGVLLLCVGLLWWSLYKKRSPSEDEDNQSRQVQPEEKTVDRDNRRNCQQVYSSSPVKSCDKIHDDASGMYEISPYATFSVPGNNSRSVTTSTLDYTMQFKTFGHIEDDDHNTIAYPKRGGKHSWHKQRYYNNEGPGTSEMTRMRSTCLTTRVDSESDETSGSPCGEFTGGSNYRVPIKPARGEKAFVAYTGYETMLVSDLFRPDSSTESNEVSPLAERRNTPRHVGPPRKLHRPTSTSSSEGERALEDTSSENLCLQPPSGFSDSRELSEAECDRDLAISKLPAELVTILTRYQERKEQEKKEFIIHV